MAIDDFGGPDLSAVGNAARGLKSPGPSQELTTVSVKKGDNGGVIICESYKASLPEGRRSGAAYPGGGDYKENPYSPTDGAKAAAYLKGLLGQMGMSMGDENPMEEAGEGPAAVRTPNFAAARGPMGRTAIARGPATSPDEY